MASLSRIMKNSDANNVGAVEYADVFLNLNRWLSIMTILQNRSEGFCVTGVTEDLGSSAMTLRTSVGPQII